MKSDDVELIYKLSPMQQAMLFHSLYAPGSGVYVVQMSLRLSGPLEVAAFERAWRAVVDRHGILRTAFHWEGLGQPVQVVHRRVEVSVARESWRGLAAGEQQARLERYLDADRERSFELSVPSLIRLALFELDRGVHQLVWSQHHLLLDGWSQGLLLRDLFTCYTAFAGGREPALGRARSYQDYIAWLKRQDLGRAEAFWRKSLAGLTRPTFLAEGAGRDAAPTEYRDSRRRELRLSAAATAALREMARRGHLTLNTVVQGAWALLLSAASGEDDVVFGSTVAGRPADLPGAESIVGLFINTLPVRVEVAPERRLAAWLAELQERQAEVRLYEHAPLVEVQRWSELPAGTPFFDHILIFENYPTAGAFADLLPGLAISEIAVNELTNYVVSLQVSPGDELSLLLTHDARRLDDAAAARTLARLAQLLAAFAAAREPGREPRLGELPALLEAERHQLLTEHNDTAAAFAGEVCLHRRIARQAARSPEAVAVAGEGVALSYGELAARAWRLAGRLRRLGVGPDVVVGVSAERSVELLVGLLGILAAGGAYLPLDPAYPAERLAFMAEDGLAGPGRPVLLVERRLGPVLADWSARAGARRVELDGAFETDRAAAGEALDGPPPEDEAAADDLAYVIYTSGSTGRPKGVQITHRALANFLASMLATTGIGRADALLAVTTLSFDIAGLELFLPLLCGARVELVPREVARDGERLRDRLVDSGATFLQATPATWRLLLAAGWEGDGRLRALCGGEALPRDLADRLLAAGGALWNLYGPTETTVWSTIWSMDHALREGERIAVGRPLANTEVYLLSRQLVPVPWGGVGELSIGGAGVARGYRNRPELTAERFLPDPFAGLRGAPGARLYRTGDLARHLPDGTVELLGRIDHQVKVRGFRIELGEIESVLGEHPGVREAVVLAREEGPGDRRLVGYLVPAGDPPAGEALRGFLEERLPEHMIPAAFVHLEALPLTPNGKVDRRALPAPEQAAEGGYEAPRTPVEEMLANIFAALLGRERAGRQDDFFALGGHSLLAMRLVSRLREAYGVELPVRALFETPRVAGLAGRIERELAGGADGGPPAVERLPKDVAAGDLPLSFAQQRLWFLCRLVPDLPAYNVAFAARLEGALEPRALCAALSAVVRRHEVLRTRFAEGEGGPLQRVVEAWAVELPVCDLRALEGPRRDRELRRLLRDEAVRPFDLAHGPLLRSSLVRCDGEEHAVLLAMHHIVSDAWSMEVLLRELTSLYPALLAGEPSPLPELPVQYADFAVWQRRWLAGERLASQLAYWRERLSGEAPVLELPFDRPRQAVQTFRGADLAFSFSPAAADGLGALARGEGATLFMVGIAAFHALLRRHTGQRDLWIGTPISGRRRLELEGLIGFFLNTLVIRAEMADDASFRDLLAALRELCLEAYAHQDLPFEQLVDELRPRRDLSHSPLFQAMFVFLRNAGPAAGRPPGPRLTPLPIAATTAKFDLTLSIVAEPGALSASIEYNADLFDRSTVARLAEHLRILVDGALAAPATVLAELPLLTAAERHQLVAEHNDTAAHLPGELCLQRSIARQAARSPEAVAVVCADAALSYGELAARAGRLARHLRRLGVGPEAVVGICAERSLELMVGLLGILAAGGAYLPLDPSYPAERLALMAADGLAGAERPVLLVQGPLAALAAGWSAAAGARQVDLDGPWNVDEESGGPAADAGPDSPAYVIYTSGSTGRPKGVVNTHRGISNRLHWMQSAYGLGAGDVVLQKTPLSFDVSVWELFWPLVTGARLVMARPGGHRDSAYLADLIAEQGITTLHFVPSMLQAFVDEPGLGRCAALRRVMASGEALPAELAGRFLARLGAGLHNLYGPTEAAVDVTAHACSAGPAAAVPIGRPIANLGVWLLDGGLEPVPLGVAGELYIGGVGLARGYLRRPELTAERFVPHPASALAGERLYRTGDLARFLPGGEIEFLGRTDQQVKIRGFRIELGEIEVALAGHPEVQAAAVLAVDGAAGQKRLVAFWVAAGEASDPDQRADLRAFLRDRLPEYMVPASFVPLAALPQTPNGKLDRRALLARAKEAAAARPAAAVTPARTPAEERLAGIVAAVLQRADVGVHDNFFELGGDSILVLQVVSRAQQAGLWLVPRDLFRHQTVAELAAVAGAAPGALGDPGDQGEEAAVGDVPVGPMQRWFFALELQDSHHFNQAVLLGLRERLDRGVLERALGRVVRHHAALGFRFRRDEGTGWRQVGSAGAPMAPMAPLVRLAGIDLAALPRTRRPAALEAAASQLQGALDLARGPLLRAALFALGGGGDGGAGGQRLFLAVHHLVVDGVSWRILLGDLEVAYRALARGEEAALPPVPASFRRWSARLAEHARAAATTAELDYWLAAPRALVRPLPVDRSAAANTVASARHVVAELGAEETRALLQEVPSAYHSRINDALLTALAQAFAGWQGEPRLLVDLEGHGREDLFEGVDASRTVGWLTSLFPVLLELGGRARDPGEPLRSIKEQLRAVPRGGIGYGLLRYQGEDAAAARLRALPAAEVLFNYLGQLDLGLPAGSLFAPAAEPTGEARSPRQRRSHLLEIDGGVADGRLRLVWTYSENRHDRRTVEALVDRFLASLRALIEHCRSAQRAVFTPSDFPEAEFSQKGLDTLMARLVKGRPAAAAGRAKVR